MKQWVVILNRVQARIFDASDFSLIDTLVNELGRERNRVMATGKPGVSRGKFASNKMIHNLTREKNPHEEAALAFAKEVAEYLDKNLNLNRFSHVHLVAEPKMLGRVKKNLSKKILDLAEFQSKDLAHLSAHELRSVIQL